MNLLHNKIARIADEMRDSKVSIIIQLGDDERIGRLLKAASRETTRRRSVVTSRELFAGIPQYKSLTSGSPQTKAARTKARHSQAVRSIISSGQPSHAAPSWASLRASTQSQIHALVTSDWVKELTAKPRKGVSKVQQAKASQKSPIAPHFVVSNTAVLTVTRDHLRALPKKLDGIPVADVFVNRRVKIPPTAKAKGLPPEVQDNRSYTWGLSRTGAMACWGAFDAKGAGVKVAVLDTGVDATHPDLEGKIAGFAEFDAEGKVVKQGIKAAYDSDQHGTHCAAIIAGGAASGRFIGMAPEAQILSALVMPNGSGFDSQILAGIDWAVENKANVISMSLGGVLMTSEVVETYTRAIINANELGIPVVVAVGNEGSQITGSPGNDYFAFTVGATDVEDRAAGFSGGRTQVINESQYIPAKDLPFVYSKPDITAPGVNVYSAVPKGKWEAWNGTSMATPHVAGAMALLLSKSKQISNLTGHNRTQFLQNLLVMTVKELGESGQNHRFGYGRLDILRAFGLAHEAGY